MNSILVTGSSGFIGYHLVDELIKKGFHVIGIDNMNDYYDVRLKETRLKNLLKNQNFTFYKEDICNYEAIKKIFSKYRPKKVMHLAAQAGVRYSLEAPFKYTESNINGFLSILECCRNSTVEHLVYTSTSSVYGLNEPTFREDMRTDAPLSLYAATKKSGEVMAQSYYHLFNVKISCARLFTVYGPLGRPDMSYFIFAKNILKEKPITIYGDGSNKRDWTFVSDTVDGLLRLLEQNPEDYKTGNMIPIYNFANGNSKKVIELIKIIEKYLEKKAVIKFEDMALGDMNATLGDISKAKNNLGYSPKIDLDTGIKRFLDWFCKYY